MICIAISSSLYNIQIIHICKKSLIIVMYEIYIFHHSQICLLTQNIRQILDIQNNLLFQLSQHSCLLFYSSVYLIASSWTEDQFLTLFQPFLSLLSPYIYYSAHFSSVCTLLEEFHSLFILIIIVFLLLPLSFNLSSIVIRIIYLHLLKKQVFNHLIQSLIS